jgi:hypothetical protein
MWKASFSASKNRWKTDLKTQGYSPFRDANVIDFGTLIFSTPSKEAGIINYIAQKNRKRTDQSFLYSLCVCVCSLLSLSRIFFPVGFQREIFVETMFFIRKCFFHRSQKKCQQKSFSERKLNYQDNKLESEIFECFVREGEKYEKQLLIKIGACLWNINSHHRANGI